MHILTKIFIVLVTLLAILLVPLVVVNAKNGDYYKARFEETDAQRIVAETSLSSQEARHGSELANYTRESSEYKSQAQSLQTQLAGAQVEMRQLESDLAVAQGLRSEILAKLASLDSTMRAGGELTETLIAELRTLRTQVLKGEQRNSELQAVVEDQESQLLVAEKARRDLREELHRIQEMQARTQEHLSEYEARFGALEIAGGGTGDGMAPNRDLEATVVGVHRSPDQTLVEIDAGSRDGIEEGWVLSVGDEGTFIGTLRIMSVDLNRSTGMLSLENSNRGLVQAGHRAYAIQGRQ